MALLAFKVQAEYDELIKLNDRLDEYKKKMAEVDTSTEKGRREMDLLSQKYENTEKELQRLLGKASETAYYMSGDFKNKVSAAGEEVNKLSTQLHTATSAMQDIKKNGEVYAGQTQDVQKQIETLTNKLIPAEKHYSSLKDKMDQFNGTAQKQSGIMVKLVGGQDKYNQIMGLLPSKLKTVVSGINGITKASLKFIATPIGATITAISLALAALNKWFHASTEGQRAFAEITGVVKGVLDQFGEVALQVGKGIYDFFSNIGTYAKNAWEAVKQNFVNRVVGFFNIVPSLGKMIQDVFTGKWGQLDDDFKAFRNNVEKAVTGVDNLEEKWSNVTDGVSKAVKGVGNFIKKTKEAGVEQGKINKERFNIDKEYSDWTVKKEEQNAKKNSLRSKMYNTNLSASERKKALSEYKEILAEQQKIELEFADKRIQLQEREMALTTNPVEEEKKLNELKAEKNRIVSATEMELAMLQRRENGIMNSGKSQSDNAIKQAQKLDEVLREQDREQIKHIKEIQNEIEQARIDAMEEGAEKTLAQMDLDHQKELDELDNNFLELRDKKIKQAKELYEANPDNYDINHKLKSPFTYNYNDAKFDPTQDEINAYSASRAASDVKYKQQVRDHYKSIIDTADDYNAQLLKVSEKYDKEQVALSRRKNELLGAYLNAETEEQKKALEEEIDLNDRAYKQSEINRQKALRNIEKDFSAMYAFIFQDVASFTNSQLDLAIREVQERIKDAKGDVKELEALSKRLNEMQKEQRERGVNFGLSGIAGGFSLLRSGNALINQGLSENDATKISDGFAKQAEAYKNIRSGAQDVVSLFGELGNIMSGFNEELDDTSRTIHNIGSLLSGIAQGSSNLLNMIQNIRVSFDEAGKMSLEANSGAMLSQVVNGSVQLLSMVTSSIQKNKQAEEEWNKTIIRTKDSYESLQIEQMKYERHNIFGVENPYAKAIESAQVYAKSMEALVGLQDRLNAGQVQTGTKKAVDWGAVGKGFVTGASTGAAAGAVAGGGVLSWATAGIGAAIGAVAGTISGLASTKVVPVLDSLASRYDWLFNDETYELNPEIINDYKLLDDETKQVVDHWNEIKTKAEEAQKQMEESFASLAGDIGSQLRSSLENAFKNRNLYSAVDDFHNYISKTLEDITNQLIFSAVFEDLYKSLEDDMKDSFGLGGDQDIRDDLIKFEKEYQNRLEQYDKAMEQAHETLANEGYSTDGQTNVDASRSVTESITESTGKAIDGRMTAIQIGVATSNEIQARSAERMTELATYSSQTVSLVDEVRDIQAQSLLALVAIQENTEQIVKPIIAIRQDIASIKQATNNL